MKWNNYHKDDGPSWTVTIHFPKEMREVKGLFLKWPYIKETDSDWGIRATMEQQYFYKKDKR